MSRLFCNGQPADATLLGAALVNYGHFTSLQVRNGAVQGWALHLQRLQQATHELFDATLDAAQVCAWLKDALAHCDTRDASVRITVFSRAFDFRQPLRAVPVDVLMGEQSYPFARKASSQWARRNARVRVHSVAGDHCYMQDAPDASAELLRALLSAGAVSR